MPKTVPETKRELQAWMRTQLVPEMFIDQTDYNLALATVELAFLFGQRAEIRDALRRLDQEVE